MCRGGGLLGSALVGCSSNGPRKPRVGRTHGRGDLDENLTFFWCGDWSSVYDHRLPDLCDKECFLHLAVFRKDLWRLGLDQSC